MKLKVGLAGLAAAALLTASMQTAATANPFGNIMNSVNEVNETVNEVNETVETVQQVVHTYNSLSNMLGMDNGISSSISDSDPTGQIMELYGMWFADQQSSEQANIAWLVNQYASNQDLSLDALSADSWFSQKPATEQAQIAETFTKIVSLVEASDQDSSRFLGYASCLTTGTNSCAI